MPVINILIAGVGGQGTLLAGKVIGMAALTEGFDVRISEVHGMAQRGGSVVTHVRIGVGEAVGSPLVEAGEADLLLSFEKLEAARWLPHLKRGGRLVANLQAIDPMPVIMGTMDYPADLEVSLPKAAPGAILMDALAIAGQCGSGKAVNMVLLGAASGFLPMVRTAWLKAVADAVPARFRKVNEKAFRAGMDAARAWTNGA